MQTSVDRPRFRQDLVAEPIEDGGAKFIDVMDPDSGTLFRFFEVEYSLACAMDGQRDIAGIVRWAEEELGLKANPNEVRTVVATLGDLGYLENGAAAAAAAATPTERPAGTKPAAAKPIEDDYLKPGVVAAKPVAAPLPAADLELGHASTVRPNKADDLPRAPELELGAPGTAAAAPRAPAPKTEDFGLGASGPSKQQVSDVSIDLADQVGIGLDDVKEAVRASQVMKAVEVPPELAAELEAPKPAKKPEPAPAPKVEAKPEPKVEAKPERPSQAEPKVEAKPEPKKAEPKKAEPRAEAKKPVVEEKRPAPPPPAKKGTSPVLIALLVLAILGAGGFVVYKYVLAKKSEPEKTSVQETPPPPPPKPEPPPVETAKLAVEQPAPEEIKPTGAGQIAVLVPNDTVVKAGDPIAKLVGFKSLEADVATVEKTVAKATADSASLQKEKEAAIAAGNKAGETSATKRLESATKTLTDAEAKLGTKKAALDKFLIKAPAAGKVTAVAKANAKITPTDVVATLTREPFLVATFKKADGATQDGHVRLGIKGSEQQLVCTVAQTAPEGTKVSCPKDAAPEGTEVTYVGVDQNAAPPPPADPIETHDTGSAAGSADTGSAAATPEASGEEGSAKPEAKPVPEKKAKAPARPRPRPRPAKPAAEEGSAPAETPAPAPAPEAPAGSDGQ